MVSYLTPNATHLVSLRVGRPGTNSVSSLSSRGLRHKLGVVSLGLSETNLVSSLRDELGLVSHRCLSRNLVSCLFLRHDLVSFRLEAHELGLVSLARRYELGLVSPPKPVSRKLHECMGPTGVSGEWAPFQACFYMLLYIVFHFHLWSRKVVSCVSIGASPHASRELPSLADTPFGMATMR